MSEFWERYRDPRWQRKRLEVMKLAGFKCQECGDEGNTLNVHHAYYRKDTMPWEYPGTALKCLCEACHVNSHDAKRLLETLLAQLDSNDYARVIGYAMGIICLGDTDRRVTFLPNVPQTSGFGDAFWLSDGEVLSTKGDDGKVCGKELRRLYDAKIMGGGK